MFYLNFLLLPFLFLIYLPIVELHLVLRGRTQLCCSGVTHDITSPAQLLCCGKATFVSSEAVCCWNGTFYLLPLPQGSSYNGCCGEQVFDHRSHLCCGGQLVSKVNSSNPSRLSCCGSESYDTATEICCDDDLIALRNITASDNPSGVQCCGAVPYDPRSDLCCGGNVLSNPYGTEGRCCGGDVFGQRNKICCSGVIHQRRLPHLMCCGTEPFDREVELCCDGMVHNATDRDVECCGNMTYTYGTGKCCQGIFRPYRNDSELDVVNDLECCGTQLYRPMREQCCGRVIIPVDWDVGHRRQIGCCDTQAYDPSTALCCGDIIVTNSVPPKLCCGNRGQLYNPQTDICCNGIAVQINQLQFHKSFDPLPLSPPPIEAVAPPGFPQPLPPLPLPSTFSLPSLPHMLCCGTAAFDPRLKGCCNGTIFEL